jgi:hypothetical protein
VGDRLQPYLSDLPLRKLCDEHSVIPKELRLAAGLPNRSTICAV